MKDLTKKGVMAACSLALLGFTAGQAQALSISITQVNPVDQATVDNLMSSYLILEDFEGNFPGWYGDGFGTYADVLDDDLDTAVGTFTAGGENGTGSTSYAAKHGLAHDDYATNPALRNFEVRDYDANGRYDVTDVPPGDTFSHYLDTADITELTLTLNNGPDGTGFNNLFFFLTDPSDIGARTTTGVELTDSFLGGSLDINPTTPDGALWFVEINGQGETLASITWSTTTGSGAPHTNDGFGIDNIGTRSVPEPTTALLLGAGLLPLVGLRRRKKK